MPTRQAAPTWGRRLLMLVLAVFALFIAIVYCTGLLPQPVYQGQDCGSVNVAPNGSIRGDPQPPENCFLSAFTRCQAARLTYNYSGIDFARTHQLQVVPATGGCLVKDRPSSSYAVPRLNVSFNAPPVYDCKSVQLVADGLAVTGCKGEDDLVIPLYPAVIGQGCGAIRYVKSEAQGQPQSDPPDALRCFWQAYTRCQAATLVFYTDTYPRPSNVLLPAMFMSFQPSNGACAISLVERYTGYPVNTFVPRHCADLIYRGAEVVVTDCGALGDIVIPLGPGSPPPSP